MQDEVHGALGANRAIDVAPALYRERFDDHRVPVPLARILPSRRLAVSLVILGEALRRGAGAALATVRVRGARSGGGGGRAAGGWRWQVGGRRGDRVAHDGQEVEEGVEGLVVERAHDGGDDLLHLGQHTVQDGLPRGGEATRTRRRSAGSAWRRM